MKRKIISLIAVGVMCLLTVVITTGCGTDSSASEAEYVWKMALPSTDGDSGYEQAEVFKEEIEKRTDGKVVVDLYGGASLGTTTEILDGMRVGVADIMIESVGTLSTYSNKANIDAMPYMYSSYEHFMKVQNSEVWDDIKEQVGEEAGFKLMGGQYRGARVVTATKEMKTLDDFKGFKLRVPALDVYVKTWEWMKSSPTPLAMTETYTAIQQHTVDGQENSIIDSVAYSLDEVCDYFIKTNHAYSSNVVIMDREYFESLPEDIQKATEEAAEYAGKKISEQVTEQEAELEKELEKSGKKVIDVDVQEFIDYYKDFAEETFPELHEWSEQIRAMDPNAN